MLPHQLSSWHPLVALILVLLVPVTSGAQRPEVTASASELAMATQNPMADLPKVPIEFNFLTGGALGDRAVYDVSLQPVLPLSIGASWTLIARTIAPYVSSPGTASTRISGWGDIQQQLFITPASPGELTWGVGPGFSFPTATHDLTRTGAWGVGPAVVLHRRVEPFVAGALMTQLWTMAAYENDRPNISTFSLQPFVHLNFSDGWAISFAPSIQGNWTAPDGDQWTIPMGLGFSKVTAIGTNPLSIAIHYYRNIARPDGVGADHVRLITSFLYPRAPAS